VSLPGSSRAHRVELPEEIRASDVLADPDYTYACEVAIGATDVRSAEQWVRDVFEGAPQALRQFVVFGWIVALGVRLGPRPSFDHVLGWRIAHSTDETIVLKAPFRFGEACNVLRVESSRIVLATFVRYEKPMARTAWSIAAVLHERIIPYLMSHAAQHR
jgi:hypothetical protein